MALCPVCGNHDGPETHCKRCHHVHDQLWLEDDLPDALRVLLVDPAELRHRRQQLRIPQFKIASKLGVPSSSLSKWENGVHMPPRSVQIRWAQLLGIEVKVPA